MQRGRDVDMRSEKNVAREHEAERRACKYWGIFSGSVSAGRCQERRDPWLSLARQLQISGIITLTLPVWNH